MLSHGRGLKEITDENRFFEDVVGQINRKLALRDAIVRANEAIALSRASSRPSVAINGGADLKDDQMSVAQKSVFSGSRRSMANNSAALNRDDQNQSDTRSIIASNAFKTNTNRVSLITASQRGKPFALHRQF